MLAKAATNQERYDEAEEYLETLIHRSADMTESKILETLLLAQSDLAHVHSLRGHHEKATASLRRVLEQQISLHGPGNLLVQVTKGNLAHKLWLTGQSDEALDHAQSALDSLRLQVGDTHKHSMNARKIRDDILNGINHVASGNTEQTSPTTPEVQVCPMR